MPDSTATLMTALNFTDDDLDANRRGILTAGQIHLLRRARWYAILTAIAAFLVGGWFIAAGLSAHEKSDTRWIALLGILIIALGVFDAARSWIDLNNDLSAGKVEAITGQTRASKVRSRTGTKYYVDIDKRSFRVSKRVFMAIEPAPFLAYYAPNSMKLVSMERLDN